MADWVFFFRSDKDEPATKATVTLIDFPGSSCITGPLVANCLTSCGSSKTSKLSTIDNWKYLMWSISSSSTSPGCPSLCPRSERIHVWKPVRPICQSFSSLPAAGIPFEGSPTESTGVSTKTDPKYPAGAIHPDSSESESYE